MTYRGVIHGKLIELEEPTPFTDGLLVEVSVKPRDEVARPGSARAILEAVRQPPHVSTRDVDELERVITAGRIAVRDGGPFDAGNGSR